MIIQNPIYVIGHRNPDSDSIMSSIAYSRLKQLTGQKETIAGRLGEPNDETHFILKKFNVKLPPILRTVKTQVRDLDMDHPPLISPDTSLRKAWYIMRSEKSKTLPVVNPQGNLEGIITTGGIAESYIESSGNPGCYLDTSLDNLLATLSGHLVVEGVPLKKIQGRVIVAIPSLSELDEHQDKSIIAISQNWKEAQQKVIELNVRCLIIAGVAAVDPEIIDLAKAHNCCIISTPLDMATAIRLIQQSTPVSRFMRKKDLVTFSLDDFIDDVREIMLESRYRSYPVLDEQGRVVGSISRYHLIRPKRKQVILMDHNEKAQSVSGLDQAEILEIIDHHRVADIQTGSPVYFRNEPVGSTSTIVAKMYLEKGIPPEKSIAGILCSAILSDTVLFKSPTCTETDRDIAGKLADIAGIDLESFGREMFMAATSIESKSEEDLLYQDFKEFHLGTKRIGVGQVSTLNIREFKPMKPKLLSLMEDVSRQKGYDLLILMITDILKEGSELLYAGSNKDIISKAFNIEAGGSSVYLPSVISRKKQVIPPISAVID